jgi:hypothetical protein
VLVLGIGSSVAFPRLPGGIWGGGHKPRTRYAWVEWPQVKGSLPRRSMRAGELRGRRQTVLAEDPTRNRLTEIGATEGVVGPRCPSHTKPAYETVRPRPFLLRMTLTGREPSPTRDLYGRD